MAGVFTVQYELRGHVGDGPNGLGLNHFVLLRHARHAKVCHFGCEASLVIAGTGQQNVVAGQVAMQDVQVM